MKRTYNPGPEKTIQDEILKFLNTKGIFCWHAKNGPITRRRNVTKKGIPDIVGWLPDDGRILAIEVKDAKGIVSVEQREFIERVIKDGGIGGVARSLDDAIKIIGCAI